MILKCSGIYGHLKKKKEDYGTGERERDMLNEKSKLQELYEIVSLETRRRSNCSHDHLPVFAMMI